MKKEVLNQPELAKYINENFIAARKKSYGISWLSFKDLKNGQGEAFDVTAYPAFLVVKGEQYKVFYGYHTANELRTKLKRLSQKLEG